ELKELFENWLAEHLPERARHVLVLVRETRQGRRNDPDFHARMRGSGPYAGLMAARFRRAAEKLGLAEPAPALDCRQFVRPGAPGRQLSLI
ncbi:MAG: PA0069 family radical SAM protein, partial [Acetobacteraceae bacterium]